MRSRLRHPRPQGATARQARIPDAPRGPFARIARGIRGRTERTADSSGNAPDDDGAVALDAAKDYDLVC